MRKKKEAFESTLKQIGKVDDSNFSVADDGSYEWDTINFAWTIWQAAKDQVVREGFVLVPKEPCAYLIKHKLWNKNSQPEIYLADDFIGDDGVEREINSLHPVIQR